MTSSNIRIAGLACVVLMVVGGFGTWASDSYESVSGSSRDGVVVMICAGLIALGILVAKRWLRILALIAALAATATAIYDAQDVGSVNGVTVGWGLWLDVAASVVAVVVTVAALRGAKPTAAPET
jgi:predicted transporter